MRKHESGYVLLVVLLLAALAAIALSTAVPRLLTQGQRQKEEELIFRGQQYRRAIRLFYRKFSRYPNSIDELLETNERAYLRRPYPDPMSRDGEWRFIRVGPGGQLIGSVTQRLRRRGSEEDAREEEGQVPETPEDSQARLGDLSIDDSELPIAGVASRSRARAIKVYKGYSHYHEWEFFYTPLEDVVGVRPGTPGSSPEGEPSERKSPPQPR